MLRQRRKRKRKQTANWMIVAGVAAGVSALAYIASQLIRRRRPALPGLERIEQDVVKLLREDEILRTRGIDVAAVAPGLIELSGAVHSEQESHHAAEVVQSVPGVHTVLNRLDVEEVESRLRRARRSTAGTEPALRWYGGGVGMGRRRQGRQTDPARRDDHADMLERALEPDTSEAVEEVVRERATIVTDVVEFRADENERPRSS